MALTPENWQTVTVAVIRNEYPRLPAAVEDWPEAVQLLLPEWAERLAGMDPSVRQEQLGSYMVIYAQGGAAWLTEMERGLLRPWRKPRAGSTTIMGPSAEASEARGITEAYFVEVLL